MQKNTRRIECVRDEWNVAGESREAGENLNYRSVGDSKELCFIFIKHSFNNNFDI